MANRKQTLEQAMAKGQAKPMSSGVGESKIFVAPEGSFPPREEWTVNGKPIPAEFAYAIPFANTDQGRQMIADGKLIQDQGSSVEFVASAEDKARVARAVGDPFAPTANGRLQVGNFDKAIEARMDESIQPWETPDPQQDLVDKYIKPGMAPRFLSNTVVKRRGMRGWQPVIDPETGAPVRMADMILAQMPKERADKRNAHYRNLAGEREKEATEQFQEGADRLMAEARKAGVNVRPLGPRESVSAHDGRGHADIGLHHVRGNEAEILMEG